MEKATEETAFIRDKERKLYGWNREEEDNLCCYRFVQWDGKIKDNTTWYSYIWDIDKVYCKYSPFGWST